MKTIRIPEDFVPIGQFEKASSHWIEWVEASGRPVIVTRRGRAVAVLVGPDEYFGMSDGLGVLKGLAAEAERSSAPPRDRGRKRRPRRRKAPSAKARRPKPLSG